MMYNIPFLLHKTIQKSLKAQFLCQINLKSTIKFFALIQKDSRMCANLHSRMPFVFSNIYRGITMFS